MKTKLMSICITISIIFMVFIPFSFGEGSNADIKSQNKTISEVSDSVLHLAYSDDFEGDSAEVGTFGGYRTKEEVDAEHGKSLVVDSTSSQSIASFYGADVRDNSIMDIFSFECMPKDYRVVGYNELFSDIDDKKNYGENYCRLFSATVNGATTYFWDMWWQQSQQMLYVSPDKWYRYDVCVNYETRTVTLYMDGGELVSMQLKDNVSYFKNFRYVLESRKFGDSSSGGVHYIDNVSFYQVLEKGYELNLGDISYDKSVEDKISVSVESGKLGNVFFENNTEFEISVINQLKTEQNLDVELTDLLDDGTVQQVINKTIDIAPNDTSKIKVGFKNEKYGFHTLRCKITNTVSGDTKETEKYYSVVNGTGGRVNRKIAACSHFVSKYGTDDMIKATSMFANAGFSMFREEIPWYNFEKKRGEYTMSDADVMLNETLKENGMSRYMLLYGNGPGVSEDPPRSETAINRFAEYAYNLAAQTKGQIYDFEVWNEYNHVPFNRDGGTVDDYINMLKATNEAIKKANPEAKVWGMGGITAISNIYTWVEEFCQKGGYKYCDGLSIHPYMPSNAPSDATKVVDKCNEIFKKYGCDNLPVVASETGWTSSNISEMTQANYSIEFAAMNYDKLDSMIYYVAISKQLTDNAGVPNSGENNFGMLRAYTKMFSAPYDPYSAKPVFLAFANFNRLLTGAKSDGKQNISVTGVDNYSFVDENGRKITMIFNSESGTVKNVPIQTDAENITVCDIYGNEKKIQTVNGKTDLVLYDEPIYIIGDYSEIKDGEQIFKTNVSKIKTTINGKSSIYITAADNADVSGYTVEAIVPDGAEVLSNNGFEKNMAEISVKVGCEKKSGEKITLNVKDKASGERVYTTSIPIEYVDSANVKVLGAYFRSKRWQGSVKIKNNNVSQSLSGVLKIKSPESIAAEIPFNNIPPITSKEILFPIPSNVGDVKIRVEGEVILDTGEVIPIDNDIYFASILKAKTTPQIDGVLSLGEWDKSTPFVLKYKSQVQSISDWNGVSDVGGNVYLEWDNDNLYLAAEINDDINYSTDNELKRLWYVDSIQFAFTKERTATSKRTEYGIGVLNGETKVERYDFMDVDSGITGMHDKGEYEKDVKLCMNRNEDKKITTYEASIPWVHIFGKKISPASLTSFYFSLLVNDNDGKSRGWIEYCPGIGWNKDSTAFIEIPVSK